MKIDKKIVMSSIMSSNVGPNPAPQWRQWIVGVRGHCWLQEKYWKLNQ